MSPDDRLGQTFASYPSRHIFNDVAASNPTIHHQLEYEVLLAESAAGYGP
jgi:hypothetical protein